MVEVDVISDGGQSGLAGAQIAEPCQGMRVAAQLLQGLYLRVVAAKEIQKVPDRADVETNRRSSRGDLTLRIRFVIRSKQHPTATKVKESTR
jgi:hypothetical protein